MKMSPPVRSFATLHAARVMTKVDQVRARAILQEGLAELEEVLTGGALARLRPRVEAEAYPIAATVAPDLARLPKNLGAFADERLATRYLEVLVYMASRKRLFGTRWSIRTSGPTLSQVPAASSK